MATYFAYGSNIAPTRLRRRCKSAQIRRRTTLTGWRLAFTGWSGGWGGGVATIRRDADAVTPGALYTVSEADLLALDRFEGTPWCYKRIVVMTADGPAYTYTKRDTSPCSPSTDYFDAITRGYDVFALDRRALYDALSTAIADDNGRFDRVGKTRNRVFVYGSLRRGFGNHRILHGADCLADRAITARRWHMVTMGSFPAVVRGLPGRSRIVGEVYAVTDEHLRRLDRLEGHPDFYTRQLIGFEHVGGLAWCYTLNAAQADTYKGDPSALSGDWADHRAPRNLDLWR